MSSPAVISLSPMRTTVTCVSTEQDFLCLEKDWNRLLMESERPVPFLTWEWVSTWWRFFKENSKLFVLVAHDQNNTAVGIAPLRVVVRKAFGLIPVRSVEFLGYRGSHVCADHLDFLVQREHRAIIVGQLLDEIIARHEEWDVLVLADLAEESVVPELLMHAAADSGALLECQPQERCPYANLPASWDSFVGSIKAKYRNNAKRRRNKLVEDFRVRFEWDSSPGRVAEHMSILRKLHRSARNRKGETGNFHVEEYRQFHSAVAERMAQRGHLYLARLVCNDVTVAALYGYFLGGRIFGYQTGFDAEWADRGVGAVLQGLVFEDAINRLHASEYDFLRGNEPYKYTWTKRERATKRVCQWSASFSARIANMEFAARQKVASLYSRSPLQIQYRRANGEER